MTEKLPESPINGVFSQVTSAKIGAGATARKTETLTYHLVRQREDGVLEAQTLATDDLPVGPVTELNVEELLTGYMPEPQKYLVYTRSLAARGQEAQKAVARGDKFLQRGKTFSAEFEYNKALVLDEENVRANFGIGFCYMARGEADKARMVFERLVRLDAAFEDEHKHLFNEFGISLRKAGLHVEAQAYYARALELSPQDENLHYNMARAIFELGWPEGAMKSLEDCLGINPAHPEARQFLDFLRRKAEG